MSSPSTPQKTPRVLVAKPGLDGHDVGARVLCRALIDAGMEVFYTGLRQSPSAIAQAAVDKKVDVVGLSILSGAHLPLCAEVVAQLHQRGAGDLPWIVGGNIPAADRDVLRRMGASGVFGTGSPFDAVEACIRELMAGTANRGRSSGSLSSRTREPGADASCRPDRAVPEPGRVVWESGLEVKPVYTAQDLEASGGTDGLGAPGEFPFTRGIHSLMYRHQPWTMRQYSGFGTAAETRERFLYLIGHGQTGLNVAFDLPTQCGFDSDHPMAQGEVGRVGMAVDSLLDMEEAFEGIDLNQISVSLTINGAAVPIMAMYFAMAQKRGYDLNRLRGTAQNDILKEYIGRGTWIYPVDASLRLVCDTMEFCARHAQRYSPVSVCGYHIRESGATPAEEMAYGIAIACAYLEHSIARGIDPDRLARGLSFNFNVFGNIWEQVAKFRAGRRIWARIVRDRFGAVDPRSQHLRMIAGGGGGGLTIEQPENNIVRGAYYALSSALSGAQTMALCCYDEAYTIPSEHAAHMSLRTMQILMLESGVCDTVDPLAGSYFVESMTNEMERTILSILDRIGEEGGIVESIAEGRTQAAVNRGAYEREKRLRSGEMPKVGVNCCVEEEVERQIELHPYRQAEAERQCDRLRNLRASRDGQAVARSLEAVRQAAASGANVMPAVIEAVTAYATVGEICGVFRETFGTYQEPIIF